MQQKNRLGHFPIPIRILRYGDFIPNGNFMVHSRFDKVINFHNSRQIISIVNNEVGAGPLNIVVDNLNSKGIHSLKKTHDVLFVNEIPVPLPAVKKYDSSFRIHHFDKKILSTNIFILKHYLCEKSNRKSIIFLLDKSKENYLQSGFEKAFIERMKRGIVYINKGSIVDLKKAVTLIKGLGIGLTPSGDDFIAGFIQGLHVKQKILHVDLSQVISEMYEIARSDNLLSNTFLWLAKEGLFSEHFKDFVYSLLYEQDEEVFRESINKILASGETSGADTLVGFTFAFKKAGELW